MLPSSSFIIVLLSYPLLISGMSTGAQGGSVGSSSNPNCSDVQLSKCVSPDNINKFRLISDEEELDSLCGANINERLRCIDNYTRTCMDNEQRSHFNKIYSESTMVIQEICADGGEYRKEFLKHSPCLKSNQEAHEACATSYSKSLEDIKTSAKAGAAATTHIRNLCCSLQEYIRCSKESVTRACGADTARFAAGFLDRMVSGLVENHCQNHKIHEGQCGENLTGTSEASSRFKPTTYFLIILLPFAYLLANP